MTVASELTLLRANRHIATLQQIDIVSTFMGAHGIPRGVTRQDYVALIVNEMLPRVADEQFAEFNDVWCDAGLVAQGGKVIDTSQAHYPPPWLLLMATQN